MPAGDSSGNAAPPLRQASYLAPVANTAHRQPSHGLPEYADPDEQYGAIYATPDAPDSADAGNDDVDNAAVAEADSDEDNLYEPVEAPKPSLKAASAHCPGLDGQQKAYSTSPVRATQPAQMDVYEIPAAACSSMAPLSIGIDDVGGTMWSDDFNCLSTLRHFGPVKGLPDDVQCGIELSKPIGNSDGSDSSGTVYFRCLPNHGGFVSAARLARAVVPLASSDGRADGAWTGDPIELTQPSGEEDGEEDHEYINVGDGQLAEAVSKDGWPVVGNSHDEYVNVGDEQRPSRSDSLETAELAGNRQL